jgi:hypothetical protein
MDEKRDERPAVDIGSTTQLNLTGANRQMRRAMKYGHVLNDRRNGGSGLRQRVWRSKDVQEAHIYPKGEK